MMMTSRWALIAVIVLAPRLTPLHAQSEDLPQIDATVAAATDVDIDAYHAHVRQLRQVVAECRATLGESKCESSLAGTDDNVAWKGGRRRIEYDWLRAALDDAAKVGTDAAKIAQTKAALGTADQRLAYELRRSLADNQVQPQLHQAQTELRRVLSTGEFANISEPSPWYKLLQRFLSWLDRKLNSLSGHGMSPGLLQALVYGGILVCVTLLGWWYARQVRRQRVLLENPSHRLADLPSAVDWKLRREQAQAFAANGDWREAVHHIYWAAISRLEALGSWPADRTRTPREYLQLLPATGETRGDLVQLTKSFERIWYGQKTAQRQDFEQASSVLNRLAAR